MRMKLAALLVCCFTQSAANIFNRFIDIVTSAILSMCGLTDFNNTLLTVKIVMFAIYFYYYTFYIY